MTQQPAYRCTCDPDVPFEPPDPTPVAVEGCPAHRARRSYQQLTICLEQADTIYRHVLRAVADGLVFYDYYDRRYVLQRDPGHVTDVTTAIETLEKCWLVEPGTSTGGDVHPTDIGRTYLHEQENPT